MVRRLLVWQTALCAIATTVHADSVTQAVSASGVTGGVAVHLGCGDGTSAAALHSDGRLLVCGLDTDAAAVEKAKAHIASRNFYGQVSAETYDGKNLPFGDNIVNLIIVDDVADLSCAEILRVLVPKGVVLVKSGSRLLKSSGLQQEGSVTGWEQYRKPWPDDIDEWTHFLYGPANNAVSRDKRVGKPEHLQWFAGPEHTRDHDALASMSAMTTSDGRVFYIYDEGPVSVIHQPADWKLIARDAFNGKLLWKREIPTWMTHLYNFRAGPVQLTRRLVSVDDEVFATLGFEAPVTKLDAATGETSVTFTGSDKTEELICHDGTLLVVTGDPEFMIEKADGCEGYWENAEEEEATIAKQIMAYEADTGRLKWKLEQATLKGLVPLSLCASGKRVFYLDNERLHCLDTENGKELWASSFETNGIFIRAYAPTVVVQDDVIMCMSVERLQAYSVETGEPLWERKGSNGFGSPADLFVIDGKAWMRSKKSALAVDIHTGELATTLPYVTNQHHHRCFRNKATENCMIIGYSGIQIFDLQDGTTDLNQWVRGLCQYGMMPANGYIYVPPDPCRCYADVKINGFYVLSEGNSIDDIEVTPVLEKGERYGFAATSNEDVGAWSTYRGDMARSGGTDQSLPEQLRVHWETNLGESVTASVIAGRKVYVAERDAYTVHCLDVETGRERWRFMANGPVDTPPTIESGCCVFGCGDGSVYCLDAEDGALVWRFKVSGLERRVGGEDRLESPWRINGAVLVLDGTVYFPAGRSSHLDGGIKLYGLDLATGEQKYFCEMKSTAGSTAGALADLLVERDGAIEMRKAAFDHELHPLGGKTSVRSMLDDSWFHRQPGASGKGQFSVQNGAGTFTVGNPYTGLKQRRSVKNTSQVGSKWNQVGHLHQKYTRYLHKEWFPVGVVVQGKGWSTEEDFQARAALVAGDRLYLAGWLDEVAVELKTGRSVKGDAPRVSVLRVFSTEDGRRISEYELESEPVWDSAAAAYGKLFLSLKSGKLICLGG